ACPLTSPFKTQQLIVPKNKDCWPTITPRPILRCNRDVHRLFQLSLSADPEIGLAAAAETGGRLSSLLRGCLHDQCVAKRRQRPFIKSLGTGIVRHRKPHVIDHDTLHGMYTSQDLDGHTMNRIAHAAIRLPAPL